MNGDARQNSHTGHGPRRGPAPRETRPPERGPAKELVHGSTPHIYIHRRGYSCRCGRGCNIASALSRSSSKSEELRRTSEARRAAKAAAGILAGGSGSPVSDCRHSGHEERIASHALMQSRWKTCSSEQGMWMSAWPSWKETVQTEHSNVARCGANGTSGSGSMALHANGGLEGNCRAAAADSRSSARRRTSAASASKAAVRAAGERSRPSLVSSASRTAVTAAVAVEPVADAVGRGADTWFSYHDSHVGRRVVEDIIMRGAASRGFKSRSHIRDFALAWRPDANRKSGHPGTLTYMYSDAV